MGPLKARLLWIVSLLLVSCTPSLTTTTTSQPARQEEPPSSGPQRTLVIANPVEPITLSSKPLVSGGESTYLINNLFGAGLGLEDEAGLVQPELAEALPKLETDTWRVYPDDRMETVYRLRSDLVWHDGTPLSAADFVFAWRAYATPSLITANSLPVNQMEEVVAPDDRTVLIRWRQLLPEAGTLAANFPPLPRHLLSAPFESMVLSGDWEAFAGLAFWTREFVGLGPYRLTRWEPGTWLETAAFDRFVLGRPKIDRIQVRFILDENAATTGILAGEIHVGTDSALQWIHGVTLKQAWESSKHGTVLVSPVLLEATYFQFRPDSQATPGLLDVRVRRALASATNKQDLNDGLFDGQWQMADAIISPAVHYAAEIDRAITKYPFNLRRAEQSLTEAGYARGADGVWTHPTQGRLSFEHKVNDGAQNVNEGSILARGWRTAGFDVQEAVLPRALIQNGEARSTFPGVFTYAGGGREGDLFGFVSTVMSSPANRWTGRNRPGWVNPEYDHLYGVLTNTLDANKRIPLIVQMIKLITDELPAMTLYYRPMVVAYSADIQGPQRIAPGGGSTANIHLWAWQR